MAETALDRLVEMHRYCRPAGSDTEQAFIDRYLVPLGATVDRHGNYSVVVPGAPGLAWSCHTDTVHSRGGLQDVALDGATGLLSAPEQLLAAPVDHPETKWSANGKDYVSKAWTQFYETGSGCLGADDTAGVWLLCELIQLGVPGRYLFHYGEEEGCIGSQGAASDRPDWLSDVRIMIALDRKDTGDIITHQCGARTCSRAFAKSLARQLNGAGMRYRPSDRGLYTDSESYAHLVPECTNLSIGYTGNHSQRETLDTSHCLRLLKALAGLDVSTLKVVRDPVKASGRDWYRGLMVDAREVSSMPDDLTLPVVDRVWHFCYECGGSVETDDRLCGECGAIDPAGDEPSLRELFLDSQFADAQASIKAQAAGTRCCRWGACDGVGPIGGYCDRCGCRIAATERSIHVT